VPSSGDFPLDTPPEESEEAYVMADPAGRFDTPETWEQWLKELRQTFRTRRSTSKTSSNGRNGPAAWQNPTHPACTGATPRNLSASSIA
jgi:hypothetical protein